jgi:hypothetical protein
LKALPYAFAVVVVTPQPVFALAVLQLEPAVFMVQPAAVCKVMVSVPARLTPSITSISPLLGQFGPKSQKAGQTPQMEPGCAAYQHCGFEEYWKGLRALEFS